MNNKMLTVQAIINSYGGKYGKVDYGICKKVKPFKTDNVDGYFCDYKDKFLIVFRGSTGEADWIDNFNFKLRDDFFDIKNIKVHSGFLNQYYKVCYQLKHESINKNDIIVCGHSLGGALATLCSLHLINEFPEKKIRCYTFGSPRVGNRKFKKLFDSLFINRTFRFVYNNDTVCKVPLSIMKYYHVKAKFILNKGKGFKTFFRKITGTTSDHYPDKYYNAIMDKK